jgi:dimethylargininase
MTRAVSRSIAQCELTHLTRVPIDVDRARAHHAAYEELLMEIGCDLVRIPAAHRLPDAVFIEDTAVVLDELAVVTRPGAPSRREEPDAVSVRLRGFRPLRPMQPPATLDGGDVVTLGRTLYVGRSSRTNEHGVEFLRQQVEPFGYRVVAVDFTGCLHLKSAVTALTETLVLVNPAWVAPDRFDGCEAITVDAREPYAANALRIGDTIVFASEYPWTHDRLLGRGLRVMTTPCGELAKAEGAVTCCSLVFDARPIARAEA